MVWQPALEATPPSAMTSRFWQSCWLAAEKISVNSFAKPQRHTLTWRGFVKSAQGYTRGCGSSVMLPEKSSWRLPNSLHGSRGTSAVPFQDASAPCASFDEITSGRPIHPQAPLRTLSDAVLCETVALEEPGFPVRLQGEVMFQHGRRLIGRRGRAGASVAGVRSRSRRSRSRAVRWHSATGAIESKDLERGWRIPPSRRKQSGTRDRRATHTHRGPAAAAIGGGAIRMPTSSGAPSRSSNSFRNRLEPHHQGHPP